MLNSLFNKVAGQSWGFIKQRLQYRRFPVKFAKILRTPFSTEHIRWLLLDSYVLLNGKHRLEEILSTFLSLCLIHYVKIRLLVQISRFFNSMSYYSSVVFGKPDFDISVANTNRSWSSIFLRICQKFRTNEKKSCL